MTTYLYDTDNEATKQDVVAYVQAAQLENAQRILEQTPIRVDWHKRQIGNLLNTVAQGGDTIIIYEAADVARSTAQMVEILISALEKKVSLQFIKYGYQFKAVAVSKLNELLELIQQIESDFIARRTTEALARRRAAGLPLGRPKGRRNKSLKLDKYKKEIMKYLELRVSKASIAKLIGCHPQTLYDWLERHKVAEPGMAKNVAMTEVVETV